MPACPLPASANFCTTFAHPEDPIDFGMPLSCLRHEPIIERGQRGNWRFVIAYAKREETHTFILSCPSLPVELSRRQAIAAVVKTKKQSVKDTLIEELPLVKEKYRAVLVNRCDEEYMPMVDTFFESLPKNDGETHESYYCALSELSKLYGNEVYVPPEVYVRGMYMNICVHRVCVMYNLYLCLDFHIYTSYITIIYVNYLIPLGVFCSFAIGTHARRRPDFYVDPISWAKEYGCPLTKREREEVSITTFCILSHLLICFLFVQALKSIGMTAPRRKKRRVKKKNSDSPSQSDTKGNVKTKTLQQKKNNKKKEVADSNRFFSNVDKSEESDSDESDSDESDSGIGVHYEGASMREPPLPASIREPEKTFPPTPLLVHDENKSKAKKKAALLQTLEFAKMMQEVLLARVPKKSAPSSSSARVPKKSAPSSSSAAAAVEKKPAPSSSSPATAGQKKAAATFLSPVLVKMKHMGRKRAKNMAVPRVSTVQKKSLLSSSSPLQGEMMTEVEKMEPAGQEASDGKCIFYTCGVVRSCCFLDN
jgi:hypothetical protein